MDVTIGILDSYLKVPLAHAIQSGRFTKKGLSVQIDDSFLNAKDINVAVDEAVIDIGIVPIAGTICDAIVFDSVMVKGILNLQDQIRFYVATDSELTVDQLQTARCTTAPDAVTDLRLAAIQLDLKLSDFERVVAPDFATAALKLAHGKADVLFTNRYSDASVLSCKNLRLLHQFSPSYPSVVATVFPRCSSMTSKCLLNTLDAIDEVYREFTDRTDAVRLIQDHLGSETDLASILLGEMIPIEGYETPTRSLRWLMKTLSRLRECPDCSEIAASDIWHDIHEMAA